MDIKLGCPKTATMFCQFVILLFSLTLSCIAEPSLSCSDLFNSITSQPLQLSIYDDKVYSGSISDNIIPAQLKILTVWEIARRFLTSTYWQQPALLPTYSTDVSDYSEIKHWLIPKNDSNQQLLSEKFDQLAIQPNRIDKTVNSENMTLIVSELDEGIRIYAEIPFMPEPEKIVDMYEWLMRLLLKLYSVSAEEYEDEDEEITEWEAGIGVNDDHFFQEHWPDELPIKINIDHDGFFLKKLLNTRNTIYQALKRAIKKRKEQAEYYGSDDLASILQDRLVLISVDSNNIWSNHGADDNTDSVNEIINSLISNTHHLVRKLRDEQMDTDGDNKDTPASSGSNDAPSQTEDSHNKNTVQKKPGHQNIDNINDDEDNPGEKKSPDHTKSEEKCVLCHNSPCIFRNSNVYHLQEELAFELYPALNAKAQTISVSERLKREGDLLFLLNIPGTGKKIYRDNAHILNNRNAEQGEIVAIPLFFMSPDGTETVMDTSRMDLFSSLFPDFFLSEEALNTYNQVMSIANASLDDPKKVFSEDVIKRLYNIPEWVKFLAEIGQRLKEKIPQPYKDMIINSCSNDFISRLHYFFSDTSRYYSFSQYLCNFSKYTYTLPSPSFINSIQGFKFPLNKEIVNILADMRPENARFLGAPIACGYIDKKAASLLMKTSGFKDSEYSGNALHGEISHLLQMAFLEHKGLVLPRTNKFGLKMYFSCDLLTFYWSSIQDQAYGVNRYIASYSNGAR